MTYPFPFIVGSGRSGTTLVRAILDSHPDLAIPPESHMLVAIARRRHRFQTAEGFDRASFVSEIGPNIHSRWKLDPDDLSATLQQANISDAAEAIRVVYALYAKRQGKHRYGDKTPIYILHLAALAALLPEARFIHVIRDGRNVSLSYLEASFGPQTPEEAAMRWRRAVVHGRRAGMRLGSKRYQELRYEDLVSDPEHHVRALCSYLKMPFDQRMLRYFERSQAISRGAHHRNLALPPTKGLRDWRVDMSPSHVLLFESLAGDLLDELGYVRSQERIPARARAHSYWLWTRMQLRRARARVMKAVRTNRLFSTLTRAA
jgi:Sulfotransferase family